MAGAGGPDLIEGAGRGRGGVVASAVLLLLGVAAAVLVARPDPAPVSPRPAPTSSPEAPLLAETQRIVDVVVGRDRLYALLGVCELAAAEECRYRLQTTPLGAPRWRRLTLPMPPLADGEGFFARLVPAGPDTVVVADEGRGAVWILTDDGNTVTKHGVRPGPPLAAVPAGLRAEFDGGRLSVLDADRGWRRELRSQPAIRDIRAVATSEDGVIWAVGENPAGVAAAASVDRGRSWRLLPVSGLRLGLASVQLVPAEGRPGAYLLGGTSTSSTFSELLHVGDPRRPGAEWERVTPQLRAPALGSAVGTADGGLLVANGYGVVLRVDRDGAVRRLRPPTLYGSPLTPTNLRRGPGGVVVAEPAPYLARTLLLVSDHDGEDWTTVEVPAG